MTQSLNKQLDDKQFSAKQKTLKDKHGVEKEILEASSFNAKDIEVRTKRLAKRAYEEAWKF